MAAGLIAGACFALLLIGLDWTGPGRAAGCGQPRPRR